MYSEDIIFAQLSGSTTQAPYPATMSDIPWGLIILTVLLIIGVAVAFLIIRKKLIKGDRNEKASDGVLMEVRVPKENEVEIGVAENMFANLYSIAGKDDGLGKHFSVNNCVSFEMVGLPGEIRFFVHCPRSEAELVEKQILGSYQDADIAVVDEYNIFAPNTQIEYARLVLDESPYCPIRVPENFTGDPLSNILSTLSKISENEGALIQLVVAPTQSVWQKNGVGFVENIEKNNSDPDKKKIHVPQEKIQGISKKVAKPGMVAEIRIVTSAPEKAIAKMHLENIIAA